MSENNETKFDPVTGQPVPAGQLENPYVTDRTWHRHHSRKIHMWQDRIRHRHRRHRIHMIRWQRLSRQTKRI